jgi:hypothetical protein
MNVHIILRLPCEEVTRNIPESGHIYPLTVAETQAMAEYIHEALQQGCISVAKTNGGLRPCIDYRGLTEITTKYRYPLQLVPAAIKQLPRASFYYQVGLLECIQSHPHPGGG